LDLLNCAAILEKQGHFVKVLDAHAERIRPEDIVPKVKGYEKIFITSSPLDRWICPNLEIGTFISTVRQIRSVTDEIYVMGYHGTVEPQKILELTEAKAVILGEPEYAVEMIGRNCNIENIKGLVYKRGEKLLVNPPTEGIEQQEMPMPAYNQLNFSKYYYEILGDKFCVFETSRGCKHNCAFCTKIMYGSKLRLKTGAQVVQEVKTAIESNGVRSGYFIDLDILSNPDCVNEVCDFLIRQNYDFKWCCQTRLDYLNETIVKKMKEAGCELIHLGVESGLQKFRDQCGKGLDEIQILNGIDICRSTGIRTLAFFIFGHEGETEADREATFEFVKKLAPDMISFHKICPYEKGDIYFNGDMKTKNDPVNKFIRKKYLQYYLRPAYLSKLKSGNLIQCFKLFWNRLLTLN
jgi:radical SAM superfamily enzyme YgiQ (UPF0313 family)